MRDDGHSKGDEKVSGSANTHMDDEENKQPQITVTPSGEADFSKLASIQNSIPGSFVKADNASLQNILMGNASILQGPWLMPKVDIIPLDNNKPKSYANALEEPARLSRSILWDIQKEFYLTAGIQAWRTPGGVPFFQSGSTYAANCYVDMILTFLETHREQLNRAEPVYIVELGAGIGRMAFQTISELLIRQQESSKLRDLSLKYVVTDMVASNTRFWEEHERFRPYLNSGHVDFAVFNPLEEKTIDLRHASVSLNVGQPTGNPLIVLANSVFDSIRQDLFRVKDGRLQEVQVQVCRRDGSWVQRGSIPGIHEVDVRHHYIDLADDNYYDHPALNRILKGYIGDVTDMAHISIPVGAIEAIQRLEEISPKGLLLLTSDNAVGYLNESTEIELHQYVTHSGAFSFTVNYDALGKYIQEAGGQWHTTSNPMWTLQTSCSLTTPASDDAKEQMGRAFIHRVERSNPINTLYLVMQGIEQQYNVPHISVRLEALLAHMRVHMFEPGVFTALEQNILGLLPNPQPVLHDELEEVMRLIWQNFYYSPGEVNVPYVFSKIFHKLGKIDQSIHYLNETIRYFGPHPELYFLRGQFQQQLQRAQDAKESYEQALMLKPDHIPAQQRLNELRGILDNSGGV